MSSVAEAISSAATAETTDVEALLAPIPGENPAGEKLQYTGLHAQIREARRADENLEQGVWKHELKLADWPLVEELTTEALATKTKDLQLCAWLAEALVKRYGFPGLRDGLKVMRGLHERFWDHVYPEADEGDSPDKPDLVARANSLESMDDRLALAIKEVLLTKSLIGINYTFLQWEEAKRLDDLKNSGKLEELGQLKEEGKITSEEWHKAKNATRRAFYEETYALSNECWEEFQALDRVMDEKFAQQTPGLSALRKTLDDIRDLLGKIVKEKRILEPDPVNDAAEATVAGELQEGQAAGESALGGASGQIRTRQEALKRLAEIANYFHRTEPHSPVSYLVQRAVRWGQMPLDMWLKDVIKDDGVLGQLRETLGLTTAAKDDGDAGQDNNR